MTFWIITRQQENLIEKQTRQNEFHSEHPEPTGSVNEVTFEEVGLQRVKQDEIKVVTCYISVVSRYHCVGTRDMIKNFTMIIVL